MGFDEFDAFYEYFDEKHHPQILPSCYICNNFSIILLAFFFGLTIFNIDPIKIWSPFFDNSTLIGILINLIIDYMLKAGLIAIFFPVGVITSVWKLTIFLKTAEIKKINII